MNNVLKYSLYVVMAVSGTSVSSLAETPSIGIVNIQKMLEESIAGKAAKNNLEKELKEKRASIERGRIQFTKMQEELSKQKMLLSAEAFQEKAQKVSKAERDLQRQAKDVQEDMQRKSALAIEKIVKEVSSIVEDLAAEKDFDFILENDQRFIVYADDSIDISSDVVKVLDEKKLEL